MASVKRWETGGGLEVMVGLEKEGDATIEGYGRVDEIGAVEM